MNKLLKFLLLPAAVLGLACLPALAHEKKRAGPNGGRLLASVRPPAEFLVTADRRIQLTFLDEHGQPVPPGAQTVTVTTGSRAVPTVLTFSRQGDVLLSDAALPAGNNLPAVLQLKPAPGAAEVVEKFNVNLAVCSECKHAEYACICGH